MEPPAIPEPPSFVFPSNTDIHTAQSSREQLLTPPPPASASPVDQVRPATIITTPPPPPPVPPPAYLLTREEREARGIVLFPSTETTSPTPPQQTDSASRGDRLDVTSPQTQAPQSVSQSEQRTPAQPPTQSVTPLEEQSTWELWGTAFSWSSTQHERQQVAPIIIDRVNTWTSDTWSSAAEGVSNWWSNYNFWGN